MHGTHAEIYLHFVWGAWDRLSLLTAKAQEIVYACIQAECVSLKSEVLALGGTEDHIHLLVRMPPNVSATELANQAKGVSSHLVNTRLSSEAFFKWQGGYAVFSVAEADLPRLRAYIANQEEHHRAGKVERALEYPES